MKVGPMLLIVAQFHQHSLSSKAACHILADINGSGLGHTTKRYHSMQDFPGYVNSTVASMPTFFIVLEVLSLLSI